MQQRRGVSESRLAAICRLRCVALIAAAAFCASFASTSVAQEIVPRLRLATYNINWGNVNLRQVGEAIHISEADIVLLQETNGQSERFLHVKFRQRYPHMHFIGHKGLLAERFGYLSRYPLSNLRFDPPRHGLFGTYYATCTVGDKSVNLVNVHLAPFLARRGAGLGELLRALADGEKAHGAEMEQITQHLDTSKPTIVAGDFNSLSSFTAPDQLRRLKFVDSVASVEEHPERLITWQWPTRPLPVSFRVDYIFHSRHFQTQSAKVVDVTGSDHFLVVSELVWTGGDKSSEQP